MNAVWRKYFPLRHFLFLFFITSFIGIDVRAQMMDSIRVAFTKKPKLTGGFSTNTSFIDGFNSPIFTVRVGLDFNKTVRTGFGYSFLKLSAYNPARSNLPFYFTKIITDAGGNPDTLHSALKFFYVNGFFEYVFFKSRRWQFSIPLQVGVGDSRYQYNYLYKKYSEDKHLIFLYQPAVSGQYRILKWFGVGLDVGYRFMLVNNRKIGSKFNSPIYNLSAIIFWEPLYRAVFPKKK